VLSALLIALATPSALAVTTIGPPVGNICAATTSAPKKVAELVPRLGSQQTSGAVQGLLKAGPEGCDAVLAWLQQGGRGADDVQFRRAVGALVRGTSDRALATALTWLHADDPILAAEVLTALSERLAVLEPAELDRATEVLLDPRLRRGRPYDTLRNPGTGIRPAWSPDAVLLQLLMGVSTRDRAETPDPLAANYTTSCESSRPKPPPPEHVERLDWLLDNAGPTLMARFAHTAACATRMDTGGTDDWGRHLARQIEDAEEGDRTALYALKALGRSLPPEAMRGAEAAVEHHSATAQRAFVTALDAHLAEEGISRRATQVLEVLEESPGSQVTTEARRLRKRYAD